ncbi:MAG: hypothetical protein PHW63_01615 [Alphaproteobacteria bacterium]|nr:hypothetical protein [Alphaproteobacteria bacterium]
MSTIGPVAGQGVISTQAQLAQSETPAVVEQPRQAEVQASVPPPSDSGRGTKLDTSA